MKNLVTLLGIIICFAHFPQRCGTAKTRFPRRNLPRRRSQRSKSPGAKRPSGSTKPAPGGSQTPNSSNDLFGGDSKDRPKGPTEITATQEAQFDTKTRIGVFIGNVKVVDPQFTMTSDRLTVHLNKDEEGGGLNDAEANGNVIIVHVNQPKTQAGQAANPGAATPARPARSTSPNRGSGSATGNLDRESRKGFVRSKRWFDHFNRLAAGDARCQYAHRDCARSEDGTLQRWTDANIWQHKDVN